MSNSKGDLENALPMVAKQIQQSSRRTERDPGDDSWSYFHGSGINTDQLKQLENASVGKPIVRPDPNAKSNLLYLDRSEMLLRSIPKSSLLKERPHKRTPQPEAPGNLVFTPGTIFTPYIFAEGSGLGWSSSDSQCQLFIAQFVYDFVPPQDGTYLISSFLSVWGHVWAHANDQWWNSKDFHGTISCNLSSDQPANYKSYTDDWIIDTGGHYNTAFPQTLLDINYGNSTLPYTDINFPEQLQQAVWLQGGTPAAIWCIVDAEVYAQGAGAYCGMDLGVGVLFMTAQLMAS